jgi:hypothetical protein
MLKQFEKKCFAFFTYVSTDVSMVSVCAAEQPKENEHAAPSKGVLSSGV